MNPQLSAWESFYVIVGSSSAALIGIQFVVITLLAGRKRRPTAQSISAFATPTVMHLVAALIVSAFMSAPWDGLAAVSVAMTVCGLVGLVYGAIVVRRARRQTLYIPVWEDWLWHGLLPCFAYTALVITGFFLDSATRKAEFVIGAASLALLLIGIHNAWDSVTHLIIVGLDGDEPATGVTAETQPGGSGLETSSGPDVRGAKTDAPGPGNPEAGRS